MQVQLWNPNLFYTHLTYLRFMYIHRCVCLYAFLSISLHIYQERGEKFQTILKINSFFIHNLLYLRESIFIGLAVRVFANGPGDLGSIPGRVFPKTQKMVLDASLLNTQHYKVRIKGKVGQSREGVAPSPTPWCSSYRKGGLRVTLDYGRQLYFYIPQSDESKYD